MRNEFRNALSEFFPCSELDDDTFRNRHCHFGLVRVASLAALADLDFKYAEISQFDVSSGNQFLRDIIQCLLNDIRDIALNQIGVRCDFTTRSLFVIDNSPD